jgi:homogentisate 1,2-dioxygenase
VPYYRRAGDVPRKRHTYVPAPDGGHLFEELIGLEGFAQESSLLYHLRSPSALVAVEAVADHPSRATTPDVPLVPRHLRTGGIASGGDPVHDRTVLLANDDVVVAWFAADRDGDLYRDAAGDELVYVHAGRGVVESSFGDLAVGAGDYVLVPAGVTHRWRVTDAPLCALVLEARGHVRIPRKYLTDRGQLREGAPFSERDLRAPDPAGPREGDEVPVLVRTAAGLSRLVHAHHPLDVVGWDGCVWPFAFAIRDFEPVVGAIHQPPPVHQTFEGARFVVCSFVPRPYDFHPDAVKVPYHHANVDSDEVLFYAAGDFMSRAGSGIGVGSLSYHPGGFVHGPQPGSVERSRDQARTEEVAVMVDTFAPLRVSDAARAVSDPGYAWTWASSPPASRAASPRVSGGA